MPATRGKPVGPADYKTVKRLYLKGMSRNEIARAMHRSGRTISKIAAELGLDFARGEQVKEATEARTNTAKIKRAALILALLEDAARLREQMWQPAKVINFGGKDNTLNQTVLPEPTFADKRNIMQAVGVALDRSVKLDAYDKAEGAGADIDVWLAAMAGK